MLSFLLLLRLVVSTRTRIARLIYFHRTVQLFRQLQMLELLLASPRPRLIYNAAIFASSQVFPGALMVSHVSPVSTDDTSPLINCWSATACLIQSVLVPKNGPEKSGPTAI